MTDPRPVWYLAPNARPVREDARQAPPADATHFCREGMKFWVPIGQPLPATPAPETRP